MFAGAVREAVFSRPEVAKKVKDGFVPVAVRAQHVNGLRSGAAGRLFSDISKSKLAGQGLAVLNSDGQVLEWVLMFDNPEEIGNFLDHATARFANFPDGSRAVMTERHMRYPSEAMTSMAAPGPVRHSQHAVGEKCPGDNAVADGSVRIDLIGRTLTSTDKFSTDVLTQDNFVQDMFDLDSRIQGLIVDAVEGSEGVRFELPRELSKAIQAHAYLGQLDACPIPNLHGGQIELDEAELFGTVVQNSKSRTVLKIEGTTKAASSLDRGGRPFYDHSVTLEWSGYMVIQSGQIKRFALIGRGHEEFQWSQGGSAAVEAVRNLPAGHIVDQEGPVQYGLILRVKDE